MVAKIIAPVITHPPTLSPVVIGLVARISSAVGCLYPFPAPALPMLVPVWWLARGGEDLIRLAWTIAIAVI
jgi:hypothetical protein